MFGIASIVAFAIAWILWLAPIPQDVLFAWQSFTILGLLCLAVHLVTGWQPARHGG